MTANPKPVEQLQLRFRAEPESSTAGLNLPGGWMLWCLMGLALGLGGWLLGRQSLTEMLSQQLAAADTEADAILALESLRQLDAAASLEITQGLTHENPRIARTAYRYLDAQLNAWEDLPGESANVNMAKLVERLMSLPDGTSPESIVLASSLASRIFAKCIEQDDVRLQPMIANCEAVLRRAALPNSQPRAHGLLDGESLLPDSSMQGVQDADQLAAAEPDAGAGPIVTGAFSSSLSDSEPGTAIGNPSSPAKSIDSSSGAGSPTPTSPISSSSMPPSAIALLGRPRPESNASSRLPATEAVAFPAQITPIEETGYYASSGNTFPSSAPAQNSMPSAQFKSVNVSAELPVLVNVPATLSNTPLVSMRVASDQPNLDGIQDLEIEELVRLLASVQPNVAKGAALALKSKGMSDEKLAIASELATGSAARRLELINEIGTRGDLDPRPWLLWMAEDGEPEVRRLSASLLSGMIDAYVERSLRILLSRERDPSVERALREAIVAGRTVR